MMEYEDKFEKTKKFIIESIKPKIKNIETGFLYYSIIIIINSIHFNNYDNSKLFKYICDSLGINKDASIDDDLEIISLYPTYYYTGTADNEETIQKINNSFKKVGKGIYNKFHNSQKNQDSKMELIIIGAATIIGGIFVVGLALRGQSEQTRLSRPKSDNKNLC